MPNYAQAIDVVLLADTKRPQLHSLDLGAEKSKLVYARGLESNL